VHAANLSEIPSHPFHRYLIDGQTKEMLAATSIEGGENREWSMTNSTAPLISRTPVGMMQVNTSIK